MMNSCQSVKQKKPPNKEWASYFCRIKDPSPFLGLKTYQEPPIPEHKILAIPVLVVPPWMERCHGTWEPRKNQIVLRGEGIPMEGHPETQGQEAHSSERKFPQQRCCSSWEGIPSWAEDSGASLQGQIQGVERRILGWPSLLWGAGSKKLNKEQGLYRIS